MPDPVTLSARRKTDRERICNQFTAVARLMGAQVETRETPRHVGWSSAGIDMTFTLNGVGATVSIDDLHGGETGLLSWYNDYSDRSHKCRDFAPGFNVVVGEYGHPRPHHKATSHGSWDVLATRLQAGLRKARDGHAFIQEEKTT